MRGKVSQKKSLNPTHHPTSSNDFGAPKAAPTAAPKAAPSRFHWPTICMWILNLGLVTAAYFALSNWTAINWMTGSYGWAALLEIGALLLLLYLLLVGWCLVGWSKRIASSFLHLNDSPQVLYLFALAMPFMIVSFFGTLALLALGNLHATNLFVATHAEAVWKAASVYASDTTKLYSLEFMTYICSLPSFLPQCTWFVSPPTISGTKYTFEYLPAIVAAGGVVNEEQYPFYRELAIVFDDMTPKGTNYLTPIDIYNGVQGALAPYKQRFGWSVLAITIICALQFGYYWFKWLQYQKTNQKSRASEEDQLPYIGP